MKKSGDFCVRGPIMLVVFGVVCLFSISSIAFAAPRIVKFAHGEPAVDICTNPYLVYANIFGNIIESQTQGRYKLQAFPNKQLGDYRSMAEQTQRGFIEIGAGQNAGVLAGFNKNLAILEMPYAFPNTEIGRIVTSGWFGKELSEETAKVANFRIMSYFPSAFRNFSNSVRPIRSPEDMKGMKMRVMEGTIYMEMVKALGASPVPISWAELYSALQTRVADGEENPPYTFVSGKLYEVQKYYTLDHHLLNQGMNIINEKFYQSLSPEDRRVFDYAARQATFAMLGMISAKESQDLETISKAGVEIYTPTQEEFQKFVEATKAPMLKVMKEKVDNKWIDKLFRAVNEAKKQTDLK
jgi:tripartite ATP-independent transporter DctP family solute receptor